MEHTQHPVEEPHMHDGFTRPLVVVWDHLLRSVYVEPVVGDWSRQQALIGEQCVDCGQCDQPLTVVSDWVALCRILAWYAQWGMGTDGLMGAAHQAAAYLGDPGEAEAVLPVLHARLAMITPTVANQRVPIRNGTSSTRFPLRGTVHDPCPRMSHLIPSPLQEAQSMLAGLFQVP